jgi:hypothetical protein
LGGKKPRIGIKDLEHNPGRFKDAPGFCPGGIRIILEPEDPAGAGLSNEQASNAFEGLPGMVVVEDQDPDADL